AKLLKRFVATPMPRRDFLLALLGSRLTFLIPDLGVLLLLGTLMFRMPIRGSLALVIVVDVVGALAFAGIGLLVACRATTTEAVRRGDVDLLDQVAEERRLGEDLDIQER